MARTQIPSEQIGDGQVKRTDLNTATSGSAVVAKLIQGTNISLSSTGADAGTGDVTVNLASVSSILDDISSTQGSILYRGASGWAALTPGTAGYILKSNGAGADPAWGEAQVDLIPYHLVSAGSTNATVVKASAGKLYGWKIYNNNAAMRKVAFHNAASTPTAGASVFFTLNIPGLGAANVLGENPVAFSTGISFTIVTGVGDSDATAVAANDMVVNLFYV